ncbi:MAG: hypothetical protein M3R18_08785, partial [Pseudomonadota bacterium]|nr:hypothetical protein [Pseudomonadota bacterium]
LTPGDWAWAAGGAFAVDDSEIGKPGECKVESWLSVATNSAGDLIASTSPACVVSFGHPVEIGGQFQRTKSDGEWGTSAGVKAKTNLFPAGSNKVGLGLSGGVNFDLLTHQTSSYFINVPATLTITEELRLNLNGGWLHERDGKLDWFTWGAGFEWNFIKPLTLIAEIYGQFGRLKAVAESEAAPPNSVRRPRVQTGLRVTPSEKVDLDLIYGHNITGENAHWFTAGLNLRFEAK